MLQIFMQIPHYFSYIIYNILNIVYTIHYRQKTTARIVHNSAYDTEWKVEEEGDYTLITPSFVFFLCGRNLPKTFTILWSGVKNRLGFPAPSFPACAVYPRLKPPRWPCLDDIGEIPEVADGITFDAPPHSKGRSLNPTPRCDVRTPDIGAVLRYAIALFFEGPQKRRQ